MNGPIHSLMHSDRRRLDALSQIVLQLHRGSREWPAAAFAARACELLRLLIDFDACLWGSVPADAPAGARLSMLGLHAEGLEPEVLARCLAGGGPAPTVMATHVEPLAARRVELRLWCAGAGAGAFAADGADPGTLQFLMPHLVEAQRENRLSRALDADAGAPARRSLALCDTDGVLRQVDEHGLALLRSEWPRWCAPRLPEPLAQAIAAATAEGRDSTLPLAPFHGRQVTVLISRSGELLLLEVRRRGAVDRLSARQRDIATLYAEGQTGPQIAAQFGLSPSTVNNHLGVIFKKLAVSSKVQLLHAMKRAG